MGKLSLCDFFFPPILLVFRFVHYSSSMNLLWAAAESQKSVAALISVSRHIKVNG